MKPQRPKGVEGIKGFKEVLFGRHCIQRMHDIVQRKEAQLTRPMPDDERIHALKERLIRPLSHDEESYGADLLPEALWAAYEDGAGAAETSSSKAKPHAAEGADPLRADMIKRCDALIGALYEWNHACFVKKPLKETLVALHRVHREAIPRITETETLLRVKDRDEKYARSRSRSRAASESGRGIGGGAPTGPTAGTSAAAAVTLSAEDEEAIRQRYAAIVAGDAETDPAAEDFDAYVPADYGLVDHYAGGGVGGYDPSMDDDFVDTFHTTTNDPTAATAPGRDRHADVLVVPDATEEEDVDRYARRRRLDHATTGAEGERMVHLVDPADRTQLA